MGLLDFLSPALTVATQAYGAEQQGEAKRKQTDIGTALQALKLKRQSEQDAMQRANLQSEITHRTAEDAEKGITHGTPASPDAVRQFDTQASSLFDTGVPGLPNAYDSMKAADPERNAPDRFQSIGGGLMQDQYKAPEAVATRRMTAADELRAKRDAATQQAIADRQTAHEDRADARQRSALEAVANRDRSHYVAAGVDKDGNPLILDTATGETRPGGGFKGTGVKGSSATQQQQQARLLAAMSEARLADERMRAYEDKILNGDTKIGALKQAGGNLMMNLTGSHSALGAGMQAGSEAALNMTDPEYAQYLRDAATIGRAEQMISPRGGNETMVRANSLLARAGAGAAKGTIDAARMARQALFGQSGGIAQTMTPQQTEGLEQGVARIKAGEHGSHPPLSEADRQKAATDPKFAAWLRSKGYAP